MGTMTVGPDTTSTEQERDPPIDSEKELRRDGREPERHAAADEDHAREHAAQARQLPQLQAEASLEEDQRDRDRDERHEQLAHQHVRVQEAGHRPGEEAEHEQQQDGGLAQAPGQPLRADAENDDGGEAQEWIEHGDSS